MSRVSKYADAEPFVTKDGSLVRELMHPGRHDSRAQSLAEAVVPVGAGTTLHRHRTSEEVYHITRGEGTMTLGAEAFRVGAGDSICIPPGTPHRICNTGDKPLTILCACAPAYSHEDTDLLSQNGSDHPS